MVQNKTDYASEFDRLVDALNTKMYEIDQKLANPSTTKRKIDWKSFWDGFGSVLDLAGNYFNSRISPKPISPNPISPNDSVSSFFISSYTSTNLSPVQQDAVALASDWKRVDKTLDQIISDGGLSGEMSVDEAKKGKKLVQQMYDHYRVVYISQTQKS